MSERAVTGNDSSLTTLTKNVSLREDVTRALRAAVVSGEMQPGLVYSAPKLATLLGVSATPVREAMLDLVKEGMVTAMPNKGFLVVAVSDDDLDDVAQLRLMIEPPTIRAVTPVVPDEDFERLRGMAQTIVDCADRGELIAYTEADRAFHIQLLEYSGNRRLVDLISRLRADTRLLGLGSLVERGALHASALEHLELVELMRDRKADDAEALMRRHIEHTRGEWAGERIANGR
ncbi:GntR family transcriptional regulator [Planctomonas sp. JC2975]|uniref:GntR family transcriptional regulator n=1 Tax=Planctomonas sp. JC2975 TaxID=2729626 RepID=UPI003211F056